MKTLSLMLLAVSVLGNVLLAMLVFRPASPASSASESASGSQHSHLENPRGASGVQTAGAGDTSDRATADPATWSRLDVSDLDALVANLHAAGSPPEMVRAIVTAVLDEQLAGRRSGLSRSNDVRPYWMPREYRVDVERMEESRRFHRERQSELTRLLGDDAMPDEHSYYLNRSLGFLPAGKQQAIQRINTDYEELRSAIHMESVGGPRLPEDIERLAVLTREQRADLADILTPDELELYDLYNSNSSQALRGQLAGFAPTEAEFRALFAVQREFDERFNVYDGAGPAAMMERQAALAELYTRFEEVMGEERYAEMRRVTDEGYRYATRIAEHFHLPESTAGDVFDLSQAARATADQLAREHGENRDALRAAYRELGRTAGESLATLLTPAGAAAFRETGGRWVDALERGSPPPPDRSGQRIVIGGP